MMYNNGFGNGYGYSFGMFHSFFGITMMFIIIAVVALLVVKLSQSKNTNVSAINTLDIKFASGEITEEEYQQRKRVLKNK
ncbi:MAG: SHOCT domain-containing protein [Acidaminobacteraceae bacterium]